MMPGVQVATGLELFLHSMVFGLIFLTPCRPSYRSLVGIVFVDHLNYMFGGHHLILTFVNYAESE